MYKKRWYDGLHDIYEGKDEFEIKFGCFGGDGGNGGGSKDPEPEPAPQPDPTPNTGFRGEQSAAAKAAADAAKAAAQAEVEANLAGKSQAAQDLQGKVAEAVAASQASPTTSLNTSMQNMTMNQALGLNVPTVTEQLAPTQVSLPGTTVAPAAKSFADMLAEAQAKASAFSTPTNQVSQAQFNTMDYFDNISNQGKYSNPTGQNQKGVGLVDAFGGTVSFDPDFQNLGGTFSFSKPLAKGGVVQQGIGSIFPYPRRR